jgi:hypothetical protein
MKFLSQIFFGDVDKLHRIVVLLIVIVPSWWTYQSIKVQKTFKPTVIPKKRKRKEKKKRTTTDYHLPMGLVNTMICMFKCLGLVIA